MAVEKFDVVRIDRTGEIGVVTEIWNCAFGTKFNIGVKMNGRVLAFATSEITVVLFS